jgi:hypothetical protein
MEHLSRDKSEALARAGFPQEIRKGDWFYDTDCCANGPTLCPSNDSGWTSPTHILCPSTDRLIDECVSLLQERYDRASTVCAIKDVHGGCEAFADDQDGDELCDAISESLPDALADLWLNLNGGK